MNTNIKGIVDLDKLTMSPIMARSGDEFSSETREKDLIEQLNNGDDIIEYYSGQKLVGYIQFEISKDGNCFVISLQVHPRYRSGVVLKSLLHKFTQTLHNKRVKELKSFVHKSNSASILQHKRLFFDIARKTEQGFIFVHKDEKLKNFIIKFQGNKAELSVR